MRDRLVDTNRLPVTVFLWLRRVAQGDNRIDGQLVVEWTDLADMKPGQTTSDAHWVDVDSDGDLDLFSVNNSLAPNQLYVNDAGTFRVSDGSAIQSSLATRLALWGDFDNNGQLEAITIPPTSDQPVLRYFQSADGFKIEELSRDFSGCLDIDAADLNDDGFLDLVGVDRLRRVAHGTNHGGIGFDRAHTLESERYASGIELFDWDQNGKADLLVLGTSSPRAYRNFAGFADPPGVGIGEIAATCAAFGDYNNDGQEELMLIDSTGHAELLNMSGTEPTSIDGFTTSRLPDSIHWSDVDGDGDLDLHLVALNAPDLLLRNNNTRLVEQTACIDAEGPIVWGDCDGDGDLDVYGATRRANRLLEANSPATRSINVALEGAFSNARGVGATITVVAGDFRRGSFLRARSPLPLTVPLPPDPVVGEVVTLWPSGLTTRENHPDMALLVRERSGHPSPRLELGLSGSNPCRHRALINLAMPSDAFARVVVFTATGRRVATLAEAALAAGPHRLTWDLRATNGQPVASGVFLIRADAAGTAVTRRLVVLR